MTGVTWVCHPARDRPVLTTVVVLLLVGGSAALAGSTAESAVVGAVCAALLVLSLRQFFFPTRYVVDEQGIAVQCLGFTNRRDWDRLRRFRYDDAGAFLSTRAKANVLDPFTGLHLTWTGNKDEAVSAIEAFLKTAKPVR